MRFLAVLLLGLALQTGRAYAQAVLYENFDRNRFQLGRSVAMGAAQPFADFVVSQSLAFNNLCSSVEVRGGTVEIFRDRFAGFLHLFSAPPGRGFTANLQPSSNDQTSSAFVQVESRKHRKLRRSLLLSREDMERIFQRLLGDREGGSPSQQDHGGTALPPGYGPHQSEVPQLGGDNSDQGYYYEDPYYEPMPEPSGGGFYGSHDTEPKMILYDARPVDYDDAARGQQWHAPGPYAGDLSSQYFENRASAMLLCSASVVGFEDDRLSQELFRVEAARGTCVDITFDEFTENRLSSLIYEPCKEYQSYQQAGHAYAGYNTESNRCS